MSHSHKQPPAMVLTLSVRNPFAELIMRGIKVVEYRSRPTNVRGRILIYASLGRIDRNEEEAIGRQHGIDVASLYRGLIIGSVELFSCRPGDFEYEWLLRSPERLASPRKITRRANPVWHYQQADSK